MNPNLNPDQFDFVPSEYSRVDFLWTSGAGTRSDPKRYARGPVEADPGTGEAVVHHQIDATHRGQVVGSAKWQSFPRGNLSVEVDPAFRNRGVGSRLTTMARDVDPTSWEKPTPVSEAGLGLARKVMGYPR